MAKRKKKKMSTPRAQPSRSSNADAVRTLLTDIGIARSLATAAAEQSNDERLARAANVLLALQTALARGDDDVLRALETAGRSAFAKPLVARPFPVGKESAAIAKDFLLGIIEEAIMYWLPGPNGQPVAVHAWRLPYRVRSIQDYVPSRDPESPARIIIRELRPPTGFENFAPARKMALHIDTFALKRRRWTGVLPPLPSDAMATIESVISNELMHGRLLRQEYARTLCMKILAALGVGASERKAFFAYRDRRRQRQGGGKGPARSRRKQAELLAT